MYVIKTIANGIPKINKFDSKYRPANPLQIESLLLNWRPYSSKEALFVSEKSFSLQ